MKGTFLTKEDESSEDGEDKEVGDGEEQEESNKNGKLGNGKSPNKTKENCNNCRSGELDPHTVLLNLYQRKDLRLQKPGDQVYRHVYKKRGKIT